MGNRDIVLKQVYILCDRVGQEAKTDDKQLKSLINIVLQKKLKEWCDRMPGQLTYIRWSDKASLSDLIQAQSQGATQIMIWEKTNAKAVGGLEREERGQYGDVR